jgi:uncharacterized protein (DUF2132 family)
MDQPKKPKDPLHGVTLKAIVEELVETWGFEVLAQKVKIDCFRSDPSVSSSLKFLRRMPWARARVESLYLWHLRELKRRGIVRDPASKGRLTPEAGAEVFEIED